MIDKVVAFFIVAVAIAGSLFLWFVYVKQFRFATILTDLLPFYPFLIFVGFVTSISGIIYLLMNGNILIPLIITLLLLYFGVQFFLFWRWFSSYRLNNYSKLLQKIKNNSKFRVIGVDEWFDNPQKDSDHVLVLIRHDVDISLVRAEKMLMEEKKFDIPSCYYFRNNAERYSFDEAKRFIHSLTKYPLFSVGFHYESVANANGDLTKAAELFFKEVEEFQLIYPIRMVAAHGDKYRNRRLVSEKLVDLESLKLKSSYQLPYDLYLSDAGGFHHFTSINSKKETFMEKLKMLDEITIGSIVQILVHPDWWF
ncbi:MAG: hypothetical protein ACXADY_01835 [Candidatus Hodarchaeales archaeon]|jgi:hypothetical protein